jgi:membrane fusion protein (multidrug efflux system)
MWVYFNVPEARYLEYKSGLDKEELEVQLQLANGSVFPYPGKIGAIEAEFNNETGNIAFRADFPNPNGLLRHGQTGTILIHRRLHGATVIPQRSTFEILANRYVWVIEPDQQGAAPAGPHPGDEHKAAGEHAEPAAAAHPGTHGENHGGQYGIVRQRQVVVQEELDDIYVIKSGITVNDKLVFEGVRQVRDGDRVEYELEPAKDILKNLKYHAE